MDDMISRFRGRGPLTTRVVVRLQNAVAARNERGATMAEYGLLLAFVALAAMGVLFAFGGKLKDLFTAVDEGFDKSPAIGGSGTTTASN